MNHEQEWKVGRVEGLLRLRREPQNHIDSKVPGLAPRMTTSRRGVRVEELFIFARFHARQGKKDRVTVLLRNETAAAKGDRGCLAHQAYHSTRDSRLFFIHSRWADEAAFEAHLKEPHTIQFADDVGPLLDHELEVVQSRPLKPMHRT